MSSAFKIWLLCNNLLVKCISEFKGVLSSCETERSNRVFIWSQAAFFSSSTESVTSLIVMNRAGLFSQIMWRAFHSKFPEVKPSVISSLCVLLRR
ncbi:unnamed protein product [Blepharisma stoltei]|uniref:Secreted protein n=1 Tax=Blepharisma stoltei TaxID=1481888 RepID=A0AAU9I878_9CILI|nr:unnamed protein product [Blepharisma stoltei]